VAKQETVHEAFVGVTREIGDLMDRMESDFPAVAAACSDFQPPLRSPGGRPGMAGITGAAMAVPGPARLPRFPR